MTPLTAALAQLPHVMQNKLLGQPIIQMGWSVAEVHSSTLLISDESLVMSNGLGKADGHLAMPIRPTDLFIATVHKKTFKTITGRGGREFIKMVNEQVVCRAKHFVGAHDTYQKRFIENRFGLAPMTSIANLFAEKYVAVSEIG